MTAPRLDGPDEALLRAFEPIVRYTLGESFLPMSVDAYLGAASRLRGDGRSAGVTVAEPGMLSADALGESVPDDRTELDFLTVAGQGEDDPADLFARHRRQAVGFRHRGGRLARVGYTARLVDAIFSLTLLARGSVPGSLARRAVDRYRAIAGDGTTHPYYGRVVRTSTWTALQYWFFYAFNDWRSGFNGANDHEADWEQVIVYLDVDDKGRAIPAWAAYAQHDYRGADLRRRWDDARELELVDGHPVVYAAAGSHASYFRPGEYLTEQEVRLPAIVRRVVKGVDRLMNGTRPRDDERVLSIAFVDYARGDGISIGPGCERQWDPAVLDGTERWVSGFRGLWGLSVQDPFQGEDAPAGPMFNRDGSVRRSWSDPVGFAGLDLEPPPSRIGSLLRDQIRATEARQGELRAAIPALELRLATVGAERPPTGAGALRVTDVEEARLRTELQQLHDERERNALRLVDLQRRADAVASGWRPSPQAHLRRPAVPSPPDADRTSVILEAWAAVSVGLLMLTLVVVLFVVPGLGVAAAAAVIASFLFIESVLRSHVVALITATVRVMAIVAGIILVLTFWQAAIIATAVAAGLFIIRENVAELLAAMRPPR